MYLVSMKIDENLENSTITLENFDIVANRMIKTEQKILNTLKKRLKGFENLEQGSEPTEDNNNKMISALLTVASEINFVAGKSTRNDDKDRDEILKQLDRSLISRVRQENRKYEIDLEIL